MSREDRDNMRLAIEALDAAQIRASEAEARVRELEQIEVAHKSLLTELWEGVRIHGLNGNIGEREGERLIHAYCGGIVTVMNERDELKQERDNAVLACEGFRRDLKDLRGLRDRLKPVVDAARESARDICDNCSSNGGHDGWPHEQDLCADCTTGALRAALACLDRKLEGDK